MSNTFGRLVPAIGGSAAIALLAACSGMQQGAGAALPATAQNVATTQTAAAVGAAGQHPQASLDLLAKTLKAGKIPAQHRLSGKSWISPNLNKTALIYASDYPNGTVDIYDFAKPNKVVGQITGFYEPYGQCVDKAGDIYVVDFGTAGIYEYTHGSVNYFNFASDNYGYPVGCAVNPTNGDIAVANFQGYNYTTGGVVVFKGGLSGTQKYYTQSSFYFAWPPGYDHHGNLFVEGSDFYQYNNAFGELPHNGNKLKVLSG
ncbi:MAG TPA: hypothetical protein VKE42_05980, partial [Candidatus Cybelea sp.]|nr:hypothetical protein [Candidatus Cybelea sp.]